MQYQLDISKQNIQPHLDIEKEIETTKTGLLTFILRVNNGNVVDFSVVEYVDVVQYFVLEQIEVETSWDAYLKALAKKNIAIDE